VARSGHSLLRAAWVSSGTRSVHAIFPGIVIAFLARFSFFIGALLFGLATAFGIGVISRNRRLKEDTAIGILLQARFSLGVY